MRPPAFGHFNRPIVRDNSLFAAVLTPFAFRALPAERRNRALKAVFTFGFIFQPPPETRRDLFSRLARVKVLNLSRIWCRTGANNSKSSLRNASIRVSNETRKSRHKFRNAPLESLHIRYRCGIWKRTGSIGLTFVADHADVQIT